MTSYTDTQTQKKSITKTTILGNNEQIGSLGSQLYVCLTCQISSFYLSSIDYLSHVLIFSPTDILIMVFWYICK